ncbi:hypothetical protein ES703_112996 [subsurface metagenome]
MAPTAHGAGIKVEQVLPAKVLNLRCAKGLRFFKGDRLKHHFRSQWFEEDIEGGGKNVQVLGAGNIDHKADNHYVVQPPHSLVGCLQRALCKARPA